jgi:cytoskeletal protein CcmA (bactofilin family)
MGKFDNLNDSQLPDILRRIRTLETASPMNNAAIGRGGIEVYDGGTINVSSGHLIVNGTATISGVLNADGTVTLSGKVDITGPLTVAGATGITGPLTVTGTTKLNGPTTIGGNTAVTGTLTTSGAMKTAGTLSVDGATTLNNTLTVASGKKVVVGGLTLENQSSTSGQVQFPGGGISASTALGMLITSESVEIAGTVVKISSLPTTTQPANVYADSNGRLYRSTTA